MKHVIRDQKPEHREETVEWWLEMDGGDVLLQAKRGSLTQIVMRIQASGIHISYDNAITKNGRCYANIKHPG